MKIGSRKELPVIGALLVAAAFLLAFMHIKDLQAATLELLDWVDQLGGWGILFYFALYIAVVLFLIPGILFTLGAGFLFGFLIGAVVVVGALAVGSGIAFLLARYAFGKRLTQKLQQNPKARLLDKGLEKEGWKIVLISRFSPVFPFKLSNYFFGLTRIPFRQFFFANLVGVMPLSLVNVYIGSLAAELVELAERERQPWEWVVYIIGLVAAVAVLYLVVRMIGRVILNASGDEESNPGKHQM